MCPYHYISRSILRPPALPPSHTKHGLATPPAIKKHSTGIRQELSLSKSKSHECELSGASREEMLMGEVSTSGTNERVDSSGYSSASEAPSATRKRLHSSEPEAGEAAHSPIASPLSPPVPPSDRLKVTNSLLFSIKRPQGPESQKCRRHIGIADRKVFARPESFCMYLQNYP